MYGHRNNPNASYLGVTVHGDGDDPESGSLGGGMALGGAAGAGLGAALGNLALGIGVGLAMGAAIGLALSGKQSRTSRPSGQGAVSRARSGHERP